MKLVLLECGCIQAGGRRRAEPTDRHCIWERKLNPLAQSGALRVPRLARRGLELRGSVRGRLACGRRERAVRSVESRPCVGRLDDDCRTHARMDFIREHGETNVARQLWFRELHLDPLIRNPEGGVIEHALVVPRAPISAHLNLHRGHTSSSLNDDASDWLQHRCRHRRDTVILLARIVNMPGAHLDGIQHNVVKEDAIVARGRFVLKAGGSLTLGVALYDDRVLREDAHHTRRILGIIAEPTRLDACFTPRVVIRIAGAAPSVCLVHIAISDLVRARGVSRPHFFAVDNALGHIPILEAARLPGSVRHRER